MHLRSCVPTSKVSVPHFARLAVFVDRFLWDYNGKPLFKDRHRRKIDQKQLQFRHKRLQGMQSLAKKIWSCTWTFMHLSLLMTLLCILDDQISEWNLQTLITLLQHTYNLQQLSRLMTKPTKWLCSQRSLRSAWASAQSDQSLHCARIG